MFSLAQLSETTPKANANKISCGRIYHCKIERWLNIEVLFYFLKFMDPHLTRNIWFCWLFNYPNWWIWTHSRFILLFHSNLFILMDKLHSTQIVHLKVKIVGQKPKRENWFIMWCLREILKNISSENLQCFSTILYWSIIFLTVHEILKWKYRYDDPTVQFFS